MMSHKDIRKRFLEFAESGYCSANAGTAVSYCRALDIVSNVLQKTGLAGDENVNIWQVESVDALLRLYNIAVDETRIFLRNGGGAFSQRDFGGKSYIEKWWCSSAIKAFAAFRSSVQYEAGLVDAFNASDNGVELSKEVVGTRVSNGAAFLPDSIREHSPEGRERIASVKQRLDQGVFRKWILSIYQAKCCLTGLAVPGVLRASHISGWAEDKENRMNPSNGLCLSATYDAAFDQHLISFDDDYRMILSPSIRDYCTNDVHRKYFLEFEGCVLSMPTKFLPSRKLLEQHRSRLIG